MKVFMIGGTGLLGSEAARELIARGHQVTSVALPPLPAGAVLPPEMKIEYGNYLEMTDDEIRRHFKGCEGFVFAAGGILGGYDTTMGLVGAMFGIQGDRISNCIDISALNATGAAVLSGKLQSVGSIPADAIVQAVAPAMGVDLTAYTREDGTLNYFGIFDSVRVRGTVSAADADGNITVASESDLYGETLKSTLGEGWVYTENQLPTPATVA